MNNRLVLSLPTKSYFTSWELRAHAGLKYPQQQHLENLKNLYNEELSTIIHNDWQYLSQLLKQVDLMITQYVFVAINRYLLLPEQISDVDDYNTAIIEYLKLTNNYTLIDVQMQNGNGNIGNFVFPDMRFLYEKKSC